MNSLITIALLSLVGLTTAITLPGDCPTDIEAIQDFDVGKYLGLWFEIERLDGQPDQAGGDCVTANYYDNLNGTVKVRNGLNFLNSDDPEQRYERIGIAVQADPTGTVGKLNVTFANDLTNTNYWIIGTDYDNYSVVWNCYNNDDDTSNRKLILNFFFFN